jgi:hypothetical protein
LRITLFFQVEKSRSLEFPLASRGRVAEEEQLWEYRRLSYEHDACGPLKKIFY